MKKANFPNVMVFVRVVILLCMVLAYSFYGKTIAGFIYLLSGFVTLANAYMLYRGISLSGAQFNVNLIGDSIINITAFGMLIISEVFKTYNLILFMILELVQTMLSAMLVIGDYEKYRKQKFIIFLDLFIFFLIFVSFFEIISRFKVVIMCLLITTYMVSVSIKGVQYINLPISKMEIVAQPKSKSLQEKIEDNDKDNCIAE